MKLTTREQLMTINIDEKSASQAGHIKNQSPLALILTLIDARARHDIDVALACYEPHAVVVDQSGKTSTGTLAIKLFTETVMNLPLVFTDRSIVQAHDVAIHYSQWTITVPNWDGETKELTGRTTDVIRKQDDGNWLIAIDNPYGTAILDASR
jgi:ketosteroid isomerase-like protein